jgi:hypothetical protein
MGPILLEQVAIGREGATCPGLLGPAVEWAERLGLPVRLVAGGDAGGPLALACARQGVACRLDPGPARLESSLLISPRQDAARPPEAAARLFCPGAWQAVGRVLVVCEAGGGPGTGWLATAADLCRRFQTTPVALVVAPSEAAAERSQREIEAELGRYGVGADVDLAVGCDLATAAHLAVGWRRCSHVFAARPRQAPRGPWLPLPEGVALLDLPAAGLTLPANVPGSLATL